MIPSFKRNWFKRPSFAKSPADACVPCDERKRVSIPAIAATDTKCGRYDTVCTTFLNIKELSSLIKSARMIANGNNHKI